MRQTMISTVVFSLIVALQGVAAGEKSTKAEFKELCDAMEGHWKSNITLRRNFGGIGDQGDKLKVRAVNTVSANGNALIVKGTREKNVDLSGLWYYDVEDKQIKALNVFADGTVDHSVIFKQGDGKWIQLSTPVKPDGKRIRKKLTLHITDNGNTHIWTDGDVRNVWHRVTR